MPIRFPCVHCTKTLSIARRKVGTMTTCPLCGTGQLVPTDPGLVVSMPGDSLDDVAVPCDSEPGTGTAPTGQDDFGAGLEKFMGSTTLDGAASPWWTAPPETSLPPASVPPEPLPPQIIRRPGAGSFPGVPLSTPPVPPTPPETSLPPASVPPETSLPPAPVPPEPLPPQIIRRPDAGSFPGVPLPPPPLPDPLPPGNGATGLVVGASLLVFLVAVGLGIYSLIPGPGGRPQDKNQSWVVARKDPRSAPVKPPPAAPSEQPPAQPAPVKPAPPPLKLEPVPPPPAKPEPPEPKKIPPEKKVPEEVQPAPPKVKEKEPEVVKNVAAPRKLTLKRRSNLTAEELRKQLLVAPEITLDAPHAPATAKWILDTARGPGGNRGFDLAPLLRPRRPDLDGLPMAMGLACRLGKEPAETLQALSRKLRAHLEASIPGVADGIVADPRPDPARLHVSLTGDAERATWLRPEAIPTLLQLLMAENADVRLLLVEVLVQIPGRESTVALARRALFDLDAGNRKAALTALADRPRADYEPVLLGGFQYPWPAVADHAAEAVVALQLRDLTPKLVTLLDGKDVSRPFTLDVGGKRLTVVQEVVRINHLGNCLLCHAPSLDRGDLVRGRVPLRGEALPAPVSTPKYYEGDRGTFVRADVTYLKQDFSVYQPILDPDKWPTHQRYDYLVRYRPLTPPQVAVWHRQAKALDPISPRKQALMYALRELTRKDPGPSTEDWKTLYCMITGEALSRPLSPEEQVQRLRHALVDAGPARQEELLTGFRDREGAVYDTALARAIPDLPARLHQKARDVLVERLTWAPLSELRRRLKEKEPEVRLAALLACGTKDVPSLIPDLKECLKDPDPKVVEAADRSLVRLDPRYVPETEIRRLSRALVDASEEEAEGLLATFRSEKAEVYSFALARALPDLSVDVQKKARDLLADRLADGPLADLKARLRDRGRVVRHAAVLAARKKKSQGVVPELILLLKDTDNTVMWDARMTLKALTGQDVGPDMRSTPAERAQVVRFWQRWWADRRGD